MLPTVRGVTAHLQARCHDDIHTEDVGGVELD